MIDKDYISGRNRKVFDTMPDSPYCGRIPGHEALPARRKLRLLLAAAILSVPFVFYAVSDIIRGKETGTAEVSALTVAYDVNDGVKGEIMLPDSSVVKLNSGSRIVLDSDFRSERIVRLVGEGYFRIKADKDNPFYIRTPKDITVKVTGTEFNLCCYEQQEDVRLSLIRGSVELMQGRRKLYEMSGEEQVCICDGKICSKEEVPVEAVAWTKGNLVFEDTPVREVAERIGRWYGLDVEVADSALLDMSFTGDFRSESIEQILELMKISLGLDYSMMQDKVVIFLN